MAPSIKPQHTVKMTLAMYSALNEPQKHYYYIGKVKMHVLHFFVNLIKSLGHLERKKLS